jgi:hypothetical protein
MPEAAKVLSVFGALVKNESGYLETLTPSLSATTDGLLLAYQNRSGIPLTIEPQGFDGTPDVSPGGVTPDGRYAPGTRAVRVTIPHRAKTAQDGSALTLSVTPTHHRLMIAAGFTPAFAAGIWTYSLTPGPTGFGSLAAQLYGAGERFVLAGGYMNRRWSMPDTGPILDEFDLIGLLASAVTDTAVPTITYPYTAAVPATVRGCAALIGAYQPIIRSMTYNSNATYDQGRVDVANAIGHRGFARNGMTPTLEMVVEAAPLSTYDPYAAFAAATKADIQIDVALPGGGGRRHILRGCQLTRSPERVENGAVLDWRLTFAPSNTTPGSNDAVSEVWF